MKKRISLFFFVGLWAISSIFAQGTKVTTGVIAYDQGRYDEALSKLQEALGKPELLKPKELAKTHYYLFQCYYKVLLTDELNKKMAAGIPDLDIKTFDLYTKARETVANAGGDKSSFTNALELAKPNLYAYYLNKGSNIYSGVKEGDAGAAPLLQSATDYITKAKSLNPDNYLNGLLLGFVALRANKVEDAITNLEESITQYEKTFEELQKTAGKNAKVDSNMVSAYQNIAQLYSENKNTEKALAFIEKGKKIFPNSPELARQELGIYQADPSFLEKGLGKFDENLKKNPNDNNVRIAYAEMLSKAGKPAESIEQYKLVLQKEPANFFANANLGAHYVNTAAAVSEEMKKAGEKEYEALDKKIKENFKAAYPYIKKAHEIKPTEIEWLDQLIQITSYLMDDPAMEKEMNDYSAKRKALLK